MGLSPSASSQPDSSSSESASLSESDHDLSIEVLPPLRSSRFPIRPTRSSWSLPSRVEIEIAKWEKILEFCRDREHHDTPRILTDYEGPDDPLDPKNFAQWKKWYCVLTVGMMCFVNNIGASVISIAIPEIQKDFNTSRVVVVLGVSFYVLGLGLGPLLTAPLSEEYGRKKIYVVTHTLLIYSQIPCAYGARGVSVAGFIFVRFLAGCFASPGPAVGTGTLSDLFPPEIRALPTLFHIGCAFGGPSMGPVISGLVVEHYDWRWTIWVTMILASCLYPFILCMPETYKNTLLARRALERNLTGEPVFGPPKKKLLPMLKVTVGRPLVLIVTEPIILVFGLYSAFVYALLYGYTASIPYIYQEVYGFSVAQSGLPFLAVILGVALSIPWYYYIFEPIYRRQPVPRAPEARLPPMLSGAIFLPISLFLFGWTAGTGVHWAVPLISEVIYGFSILMLFLPAITYTCDAFPEVAASVSGANSMLRYTAGFIFPLFSRKMFESLGIKWGMTLLGGLSLLLMPMPFVFMKWGPAIRAKGRFNRRHSRSLK